MNYEKRVDSEKFFKNDVDFFASREVRNPFKSRMWRISRFVFHSEGVIYQFVVCLLEEVMKHAYQETIVSLH